MTKRSPDDGRAAEQGRGGRGPPAGPIAAFVYPDGSTEELQPPGAAALLAASPGLVDYARAHAESATSRVRFFWQYPGGQWLRVHLDSAPPDPQGSAVLVALTPASSARPAGPGRPGWRWTAGTCAFRCRAMVPCRRGSPSATSTPGRKGRWHRRPQRGQLPARGRGGRC